MPAYAKKVIPQMKNFAVADRLILEAFRKQGPSGYQDAVSFLLAGIQNTTVTERSNIIIVGDPDSVAQALNTVGKRARFKVDTSGFARSHIHAWNKNTDPDEPHVSPVTHVVFSDPPSRSGLSAVSHAVSKGMHGLVNGGSASSSFASGRLLLLRMHAAEHRFAYNSELSQPTCSTVAYFLESRRNVTPNWAGEIR